MTPLHVSAASWLTGKGLFADEADFQAKLVSAAKKLGWRVFHVFDARRSEPGFPDLVLLNRRQRRLAFIELKTPEGSLTEEQSWWLATLAEAGQEVHVFRYADWDRALSVLARKPGGAP